MNDDTTEASEAQAPTNEYLQPLLDTMNGPFSAEWMEAHDELRRRVFVVARELVRVRRENETLRAQVAAHEDADCRWSADMAALRDELRAERALRAQMIADRDARSGEPL